MPLEHLAAYSIFDVLDNRIATLTDTLGELPAFIPITALEAYQIQVAVGFFVESVQTYQGIPFLVVGDEAFSGPITPLHGFPEWDNNGVTSGQYLGIPHTEPKVEPKVYHKHSKDDWGTPQAFFNTVAKETTFDLDVCADVKNSKCPVFLSSEMDALSMDWWGTIWMNPPYSKVGPFMIHFLKQFVSGNVDKGYVLVAARTDTQWFQAASTWAAEIRFLKGRLTFESPIEPYVGESGALVFPTPQKNPAPFPSALLIFDRSITEQKVVFWDWKKGLKTSYAYKKKLSTISSLYEQTVKSMLTSAKHDEEITKPVDTPQAPWKVQQDAYTKSFDLGALEGPTVMLLTKNGPVAYHDGGKIEGSLVHLGSLMSNILEVPNDLPIQSPLIDPNMTSPVPSLTPEED